MAFWIAEWPARMVFGHRTDEHAHVVGLIPALRRLLLGLARVIEYSILHTAHEQILSTEHSDGHLLYTIMQCYAGATIQGNVKHAGLRPLGIFHLLADSQDQAAPSADVPFWGWDLRLSLPFRRSARLKHWLEAGWARLGPKRLWIGDIRASHRKRRIVPAIV